MTRNDELKAAAECLRTFASGATRSADVDRDGVRFDLISPVGWWRLAARYGLGAKTHGDRNWEKGVPASVVINHMQRHENLWLAGDRSDDHLAAIAWGCFALMHYEEYVPEMIDIPARQITEEEPDGTGA